MVLVRKIDSELKVLPPDSVDLKIPAATFAIFLALDLASDSIQSTFMKGYA